MTFWKRLIGTKELPNTAPAGGRATDEKGWYLATAHGNRIRQIVLTLPPTCVCETKFAGLMLFPHYRVTQKDWLTEVFTLDGDPGPYLIVRADNVTAKLRGHMTRLAFAFCHMKSSGVLSILVNVDCPPATCREIGFANIGFEYAIGLDTERALNLYSGFIRRPKTHICFAERTEGQGEYFNVVSGDRMTGFPQGRFDLVSDVPADCLAVIEREWNALLSYHKALPRSDFESGVKELWKLSPNAQEKCPILSRGNVPDLPAHHALLQQPSPDLEANLRRWKSSGEPEAWVGKHLKGWNHQDWLDVLASLRRSQYWPMEEAAIGQHLEMLRAKLMTAEVEPSAAPDFEPPSIHDAASDGQLEWVKALLKKNPDLVVSKDNNGGTPLHLAVVYGRGDVVEFLLANRADTDARDNEGGTPLHLAAKGGYRKAIPSLVRKDILELLLANGANVNATTTNGLTPLHIAAVDDQEYAAILLLRNNADVNAREKTLDDTPLHYAAFEGHEHMVALLLSYKADVNAKNKKGVTPSYAAAYRGHKDLAELLRRHGGHEYVK